ncbi:MAG: hypothetical protein JWM71_641 [Solirubrobacteraceae bacterium]|nr:hypothetical protein [Solirubrobacteraceae bacterium]
MFNTLLAPLPPEVASVLQALADDESKPGLKLNDLSAATGLPTGHVGRHLRTLERDRLAQYGAGAWHATMRGQRHQAMMAVPPQPLAA